MKIIFICGCLENGKDGVGDYTRRLAGAMLQFKHEIKIIAIKDSYVKSVKTEIIQFDSGELQCIRYPESFALKQSSKEIQTVVNAFNPDFISIQFVIFGLHPKGLPFDLAEGFKTFCKNRLVHIMFHEMWLGMEKNPPLKFAIWGYLQKYIITNFIKSVKPVSIHTNSDWYLSQFKLLGYPISILPLFSNIPLNTKVDVSNKVLPSIERKNSEIKFVLFGHISLGSPVESFVTELSSIAKENDWRISLTMAGNNNSELERWSKAWKSQSFDVRVLGILPTDILSEVLLHSDIGITTTPLPLLTKSGSFMAMIDHRLPIINISDSKELEKEKITFNAPQGLYAYKLGNLKSILSGIQLPIHENRLQNVASKLNNELSSLIQKKQLNSK